MKPLEGKPLSMRCDKSWLMGISNGIYISCDDTKQSEARVN